MSGHEDWIGRRVRREERITPRLIAQVRATLAGVLGPGAVPPGLHLALVPDLAEPADLGRDGHPRPGLFVPDLSLPRRMWAGGEMVFHAPFAPGERVATDSTVSDIVFKQGSTGPLAFVTVLHDWRVEGEPRLSERQDIVYRGDPAPGAPAPAPAAAEPWAAARVWTASPDPVLLFRYSALTFNSHRIHYDLPYATGVEGYAGLVVHGPLQALWMLNLAADMLGRLPAVFRYRGLAPLICGTPVRIEAREGAEAIGLRVVTDSGSVTMRAEAQG
jgi:3-methylfumaryl-CoA hydratase